MAFVRRGTAVIALDILGLLFLSAAIIILGYGGWTLRIAGIRITSDTAWRPLLWAAGLGALRLFLDRRTPLVGRPLVAWAAMFGVDERVPAVRFGELPPWRELLTATAALVAAIAVVLHKQFADWYAVSDMGEPLFSMWRIGWVAHQIVADPRHLFDAHTFHPEHGTLTYSDSMLLPALISAPLIWLGVPIAVAYTFLLLSAIVSSAVATYLLARVLRLSPGASWVAALIFALCQYRFEHYSHLELQMAQWMPLALLAAVQLLATGRARYFVYLTLAAVAQWYSSMYYGFFLSVYAGVFILVLAVIWRPGWRRFAAATTAMVCGLALALPLARVYKSTEAARGLRGEQAVTSYSARPADYLVPHDRSVYRHWRVVKGEDERLLFPHFTPVVLAAAGAWPPLTASRLALVAAGWVAFDGSLGFNGHWYRWAYEHLDPLKSLRAPVRFAILVNLTLALLGGFGAQRIARLAASSRAQRIADSHRRSGASDRVVPETGIAAGVEAAAAALRVVRTRQRCCAFRVSDGSLRSPILLHVALDDNGERLQRLYAAVVRGARGPDATVPVRRDGRLPAIARRDTRHADLRTLDGCRVCSRHRADAE